MHGTDLTNLGFNLVRWFQLNHLRVLIVEPAICLRVVPLLAVSVRGSCSEWSPAGGFICINLSRECVGLYTFALGNVT